MIDKDKIRKILNESTTTTIVCLKPIGSYIGPPIALPIGSKENCLTITTTYKSKKMNTGTKNDS